MLIRKARLLTGVLSVIAVSAAATPVVIAATTGDGDDSITPASTMVTAQLKPGTTATISGTVNGAAATATCTGSTFTFTTPASGLGPVTASNPTFTGCTDGFGTDTVTTNSTHGPWTIKFADAANDEAKEVSGDRLKVTIPRAGLTIQPSSLACTITLAPKAAAPVTAAYNDVSTAALSNAVVPASDSGSGCSAGSGNAKVTAKYVLSPGIQDAS